MTGKALSAGTGRVSERRRAVALARHYREYEAVAGKVNEVFLKQGIHPKGSSR